LSVVVITPSTGRASLAKCITSVQHAASIADVEVLHLIILDGPDAERSYRVLEQLDLAQAPDAAYRSHTLTLPYATRRAGAVARSVGASMVPPTAHYVTFLDDDNWYAPDFFQRAIVDGLAQQPPSVQVAFCLRECIHSDDSPTRVVDRSEAIGPLGHVWNQPTQRFIDTNCYVMRARFARRTSAHWSAFSETQWGDDRVFYLLAMSMIESILYVPAALVHYEMKRELIEFVREGNMRTAATWRDYTEPVLLPSGRRTTDVPLWTSVRFDQEFTHVTPPPPSATL
jgi:glycosyltransferase involved in cell wall biosynthesis